MALKILQERQSQYLVELRRKEILSDVDFKLKITEDLYSRYRVRRLSVNFQRLQTDIALKLYSRFWISSGYVELDINDPKWVRCMHAAADAIYDCIDHGYIECISQNNVCLQIKITSAGSDLCSSYYFVKKVFNEFGIKVGVKIGS